MQTLNELMIRLLQNSEYSNTVKVLVRDRNNKVFPIEAVVYTNVQVPTIHADLEGPLKHNESILVLDIGPAITQNMRIE